MAQPETLYHLFSKLSEEPFSSWSYDAKSIYKNMKFTPHLDVKISDGKQSRNFQYSWYNKFPWLAGCSETNRLYCYPCILFCGVKQWACVTYGVIVSKNFLRKAESHQTSKKHLQNEESFHLLGRQRIGRTISKEASLLAVKHNELVKQNRLVIQRLIDVVCFLGKQELSFRGHNKDESSDNTGNYLELLELLSKQEQFIRDHLQSTYSFKGTSRTIQNDLIESIANVMNEHIKEELHLCDFVTVQADVMPDVFCKSQMSIIVRFCTEAGPKERFLGFYDVSSDKTALGLSKVIINVLESYGITDKIISHTYDGVALMAEDKGGVQHFVKQACPRAVFLHCYAHELNLVMLHGSKNIKEVKLFIYNIAAFHMFFSKSSNRTQVLESRGFRLPQTCSKCWNFNSRAVHIIYTKYNDIKDLLQNVTDLDEDWDPELFNSASGLLNILRNRNFIFLLCLYKDIFVYIDHLFELLQNKILTDVRACNSEVKTTIDTLKNMKSEKNVSSCVERCKSFNNEFSDNGQNFLSLKLLAYEILDTSTHSYSNRNTLQRS